MKIRVYIFVVLILSSFSGLTQSSLPQQVADSIWNVWTDKYQHDTIRLEAIKKYAWDGYLFSLPDSAYYYAQLQYDFASFKGLKKYQADALNTQGASFFIKSDYAKSIDYNTRSLKIREEINDKKGIAASLGNIGNIYKDQGDAATNIVEKEELYKKAINFHNRSLKIKLEINEQKGIAASLSNLGIIYRSQGYLIVDTVQKNKLYQKALDCQLKSLKIQQEIDNKRAVANVLSNIGLIYAEKSEYESNPLLKQELFKKSIAYHEQSMEIQNAIGNKQGVSRALINIGDIYLTQVETELEESKKNKLILKVIEYNKKALKIALESKFAREIETASKLLYTSYKITKQYKLAVDMHELYSNTRDSIDSEENQNEVIRQELKYNYEKKAVIDSIANAKEKQIKDKEIAKQQIEIKAKRIQQYGLFGGLFILILFASIIYNRLKVAQKQKLIIEKQKELVEEKQKEIIDSIHYAKRIQDALLTSQNYIERNISRLKNK
ncbi:MAG: hypothetical protein KFKLKKLM_02115 [Flavobacteriales bacterium]|nr:hypothetical protein [Flavobacteriales bacterium]